MIAIQTVLLFFLALAGVKAAEVPANDVTAKATQKDERRAYILKMAPDDRARYIRQVTRFGELRGRITQIEREGRSTTCSREIIQEASWMAGYAPNGTRLEARLDEAERVLANPELEARATMQDPADGSWGQCHAEWFFKLNATWDHISSPAYKNEKPQYALRLLDKVNSERLLRDYLESIAVSDFAATGVDHRRELNESLSHLTRMILRDQPSYYSWQPGLKAVLLDELKRLRNPQTGWWGERYLRNGKSVFVDDLSITFHVVSYLRDEPLELGAAMDHLLAVKDLDYPIGWLEEGRYSNHNNMDVATLLKRSWPQMSAESRAAAVVEIRKMLAWCLKESIRADGSFAADAGSSDSEEEATSWGASFLARLGYFDPAKRFWTNESSPEADAVRQRIIAFIEKHLVSGGAGGTYYAGALEELRPVAASK